MARRPIAAKARASAFVLTAVLASVSTAPSQARAQDESARVTLDFVGGVIGLPIMRARVDANVTANGYAGNVFVRSAGLVGFFKPAQVTGSGAGRRGVGRFLPESYTHLEVNGRKRREIWLTYERDDVRVEAEPPFTSFGDPAPTPEQKRAALDPLAMVLQLALEGGEEPCARVVPVFDSKQRYDLEFHPDGADNVEEDLRTRGYRGPAVRCRMYYRPIAGYDPEDLADDEVYATPIRVWFAEIAPGVRAPALIRARFGPAILPFGLKVELRDARVAPNDETSGADRG